MHRVIILSVVVAACGAGVTPVWGEDWPRWRGPEGTGHAGAEAPRVGRLPGELPVVWKQAAGPGLASPVVAGGRGFLFEAAEGREVLRAVKAADGVELWRADIDATFSDSQGPAGPRCTPAVDGDKVYAVSCRGELQCLQVSDGKKVWSRNYVTDFGAYFIGEKGQAPGATRHGNNGSPLIVGDRLYACAGGTNGAGVVCLNKRTGDLIWKSQSDVAAYAPPVRAEILGVAQIVCFTVEGALGLAERDGAPLWRRKITTGFGRHVTTPVVSGDRVILGSHQAGLLGIQIRKDGDGWAADGGWSSKELSMNYSSPVRVGGQIYGLGPRRNLFCADVADGKVRWSQEGYLGGSPDKSHAGLVVVGDRILVLTDSGELVAIGADPAEFKEFGRVQVCGLNWCNPGYADGNLWVRDGLKQGGQWTVVRVAGGS